jgi:septal ring factor EnvC (AmiA/AmiB activator)
MTVQLSPHKVRKILRGYFCGLPQIKIAQETGVDQSSISHYASRFKEMAAEYGLLTAGKEYQVLNEVESLRSLSVELQKSKLTTEDAKHGHNIIKAFMKLGISPGKHFALIEVCKKVEDLGFVEAALKLSQIEAQAGMGYNQVMADFEKVQKELPQLKEEMIKATAKLESINDTILRSTQELDTQKKYLKQYKDEVKAEVAKLGKELAAKKKQLEVDNEEVKKVAQLKNTLAGEGLDIATLIQLAKEYKQ